MPKNKTKKKRGQKPLILSPADEKQIEKELKRFTPLYLIAAKLNLNRHTVADYINRTPHLKQVREDQDEGVIDLTAHSLFQAALGNLPTDERGRPKQVNVNAAIFLLERLGRRRGFAQHIEVEQAQVPAFTFNRGTSSIQPLPTTPSAGE